VTALVITFVVTLVLTPAVAVGFRRRGLLDVPNPRSSHTTPVPRGAGLAVIGGVLAGVHTAETLSGDAAAALAVTGLAFAAIGLADDLRPTPAIARLGLQAVAATVALRWLLDDLGGPVPWRLLFTLGCLVWLISYVNAFNFMDGINGISAAQVVVAGGTWTVAGLLVGEDTFAMAGALIAVAGLGFAPFNFPRASVFLGDVGSYFMGSWLAAGAVLGLRLGVPPETVLAPLVLYLGDTGTTIVRRLRTGEVWHAAHRSHAYQRLVWLGWSHTRTTCVVAMLVAVCGALGIAALHATLAGRIVVWVAVLALTALYVAAPSVLEQRRHKSPTG
jgi:UDP-GlcNAc:undecaprenyl-phosphate GlcNAc-1-phosphate transferase